MKLRLAVAVSLGALVAASFANGQTRPPARHLVGDIVGGQLRFDMAAKSTLETVRLTFNGTDGAPAITVEFVARYATDGPGNAPAVVDMIVTELSAEDQAPQMTCESTAKRCR